MSSIEEMDTSRAGSTSGLLGATGFSTMWRVTTDDAADDPVIVLNRTSGGVASGTPHPWDASQIAVQFTRVERLFDTKWIIRADYQLPVFETDDPTNDTSGWRFSVDTALETELVTHDLNGKLIGTGAYRPASLITDDDEDSPTFGLPIGSDTAKDAALNALYPSIDIETAYEAMGQLVNVGSLVPIQLLRIKDKQRTQPLSRTVSVSILVITRTFATMTTDEIASVNNAVNTVSSNAFFGAAANTLKVVGSHVNDRVGTLAGQATPGIVYDVSIVFQYRPDGHIPVRQSHIFIDDFGTESVVTGPGAAVDDPDTIQSDDYVLYGSSTYTFTGSGKFLLGPAKITEITGGVVRPGMRRP